MRLVTTTIVLAALLVSRAAGAAGSEKELGKGASGPAAAAGGPSGGGSAGGADASDRAEGGGVSTKRWDVGVGFEYHHMLAPEDVTTTVNKNVDYWGLSARYDITPYDRISASGAVYQYFLSDQTERGARLDDLLLAYTRRIPLPAAFTLYVSPGYVIPLSFGSQLAGSYGEPRLQVELSRLFFGSLSLSARLRGSVYLFKASTGGCGFTDAGLGGFGNCVDSMGAANPNPKGGFAGRLTADFSMPFHPPLSIGISAYDSYLWYYGVANAGTSPGSDGGQSAFGMTAADPAVMPGSQPMQQFYGYEIYARYFLPNLAGLKLDASFTFAPLGDATLGWTSVLHGTGVPHVYGYYRQTAEVYLALNAHY